MASCPSFSVVFLATASLLLTGHATARNLEESYDLCQNADFKDLCRNTIQGTNDPNAAVEMSINKLITKTENVKKVDERVSKQPKMSACSSNYDSAINNLKKALESVKQKDKQALMTALSHVVEDYSTCDDMVADGPLKSPLGSSNQDMIQMVSNILALATMIKF
ncbi:hypothetical protein SLEP1_g25409 [Rubroshorea leprosula]|uniref:Pectinesterase inhibitor domain-containing protein n=1 Tax=Rubroshorea leprosula TaxID=152421 RepID=A0AAV5JTB9_9ROSI|nr:hypothetical protein SLEP1_g25409 [Rubroshorea leprosula]